VREKTATLTFILVLLAASLTSPAAGQENEELKPVLLVIDVQNVWMPMMAKEDVETAPDKINELIALFREYKYPVIRVYHSSPEHGPEPDTEPFEFPATIDVTDSDPKVIKNFSSSFTKTDLEQILEDGGHNAVFLCGLSATGCVLATYYGATDRRYPAIMVKGTLLSHNAEYTKVIEDICYSMTIEEVKEALDESDEH
jgi:nicotinamidase-related amidase